MKKIDLHIHTVPSPLSDRKFEFCLETLKAYVVKLEIDCIAITNHNLFDLEQFNEICSVLSISVLPGIEIDLEKGHLLLISDCVELADFDTKCKRVAGHIQRKGDEISLDTLQEIFVNLDRYILIPHYEKSPVISDEIIAKLKPHVKAGEVTSPRKFKACNIDANKLTPVIFSDIRVSNELTTFPTRQTFVDLQEVTFRGLKACLSDKAKVCLTSSDGNRSFQVTDDGLYLSTGLNVILGERSTGKTHLLDRIMLSFDKVKYIEQFSLLANDEEKFRSLLSTRNSTVNEEFFKEFKDVVADVVKIDLRASKVEVEKYISTLLKFASESDKLDSYAKARLFSETLLTEVDLKSLYNVIDATTILLENVEYSEIIGRHVTPDGLRSLLLELISKHNEVSESNLKKRWVNDLVSRVSEHLRSKTTTAPPIDLDFYDILFENEKVKKFNQIVTELKTEREIERKEIRNFKVVACTKKFSGAQQMKLKSGKQLTFTNAFAKYNTPYSFLNLLKEVGLPETDYHKYFVNIEFKTLNKHNYPVSGGERAEFNLLHEIRDALHYDLLLIDEPESSFDNLFLKNDVNELLKEIAKEIPVVVVTHNSTVGASIRPDFIVYTKRTIVGTGVQYDIFCGYPADKQLKSIDGKTIDSYNILLSCLEAGEQAYDERRITSYEILKN